MSQDYPRWRYYPRWQSPPPWVNDVVQALRANEAEVDTLATANRSDVALEVLRPGLEAIGFSVEHGKTAAGKLFRPVLFGDNGSVERQYQIDAYNSQTRVALEVEAGRSVLGNAIYWDLIQMSLLVDVSYAVVAIPIEYRYKNKGRQSMTAPYRDCTTILEAIYGGRRLELPFDGFLLIGY